MRKQSEQDLFQWFLTNNIIPLLTSSVVIALSWASLGAKIDLLNQKVDFMAKLQNEYLERNRDVQQRLGEAEAKIREINIKLGFNNGR